MATQTTNLGLTKPAVSDQYDISVFNSNADIIDTSIGNIKTDITSINSSIEGKANAVNGYSPYVFAGGITFSAGVGTYTLPTGYTYLGQAFGQMNANTGYYVRAVSMNATTKILTVYAYDDAGNGLSGYLGVTILVFRK